MAPPEHPLADGNTLYTTGMGELVLLNKVSRGMVTLPIPLPDVEPKPEIPLGVTLQLIVSVAIADEMVAGLSIPPEQMVLLFGIPDIDGSAFTNIDVVMESMHPNAVVPTIEYE